MSEYYIYIMTNKSGTLYTGMTNNLVQRVYQHKRKLLPGFTNKYNITRLVFFESFGSPREAIAAEKRIKGWTRAKKVNLIKGINPEWNDLSSEWFDDESNFPQKLNFAPTSSGLRRKY